MRVAVGCVAVVAAVSSLLEQNIIAEDYVFFCATVHELRDRGVEAEGFVDRCGEGGELSQSMGVQAIGRTERQDLLSKCLLQVLCGIVS
jgi:hypothetical protein